MTDLSQGVLYPRTFEIFRLEALGDDPYLGEGEARSDYDRGRGLSVISTGRPPTWFLNISVQRYRFSVTYYAASSTPLRDATWEGDGESLLCRRVIDVFYPEGDPGRRVPYADVVSVTREVSADGVISCTLASPTGDDEFRETTHASVDALRLPEPAFGDWRTLVEAEYPSEEGRFGDDALGAALTALDSSVASATPIVRERTSAGSGWRVPTSPDGVLAAVDDIVAGRRRSRDSGAPVLERGSATVLPLAIPSDPGVDGRAAEDETRRISALAADVEGALEHRAGRAVVFDLAYRGADSVAAYAAALRDSGAAKALVWDLGDEAGAALVWTGDAGHEALALHVVPSSWIDERRAGIPAYGIRVGWSAADIDR